MKKVRLFGVELCRGIATYAVVLVHSGDETWGLPITDSAIQFRLFFYFAVPFFLAAAFFFMTSKVSEVYSAKFWRPKIERILVPYALWSMIYFVVRSVDFTLSHRFNRLNQILNDPMSIIFFGGASYQLYFLPLLFTGTLWALLLPFLYRPNVRTSWLWSLTILSIVVYEVLIASGNDFRLEGTSTAFSSLLQGLSLNTEQYPWIRFLAVEISWLIRCSPYFLAAVLIRKLDLSSKLIGVNALTFSGVSTFFVLADTLGRQFLPPATSELFLAFSMLALSFALSGKLNSSKPQLQHFYRYISNLGTCSFGIYLIHPFIMNLVKPTLEALRLTLADSITVYSMFFISVLCFSISWITVAYLSQNKTISKYLFGS